MSAHLHMQQFSFSPPLMNNLSPASPPISATLLSKGKHTIGHETNLCRAPIWHTRAHGTDDDTVVSPALFGHHFRKVEGRCLTTTDQRLFTQLTTTLSDQDAQIPGRCRSASVTPPRPWGMTNSVDGSAHSSVGHSGGSGVSPSNPPCGTPMGTRLSSAGASSTCGCRELRPPSSGSDPVLVD